MTSPRWRTMTSRTRPTTTTTCSVDTATTTRGTSGHVTTGARSERRRTGHEAPSCRTAGAHVGLRSDTTRTDSVTKKQTRYDEMTTAGSRGHVTRHVTRLDEPTRQTPSVIVTSRHTRSALLSLLLFTAGARRWQQLYAQQFSPDISIYVCSSSGVARILLRGGARARGARVPKFVVTKSHPEVKAIWR